MADDFRTLYCDPGEDFGWCLGYNFALLSAGTEKMWPFADEIWASLNYQPVPDQDYNAIGSMSFLDDRTSAYVREGQEDSEGWDKPIGRIVCEDFRIYPWKTKALKFNPVRTARVIGAITFMCRQTGIELVLQPAAIKKAAVSAGAEELFYHPLKENRHQNDAIMHYIFYTNTEMRGITIDVPNEGVNDDSGVDD